MSFVSFYQENINLVINIAYIAGVNQRSVFQSFKLLKQGRASSTLTLSVSGPLPPIRQSGYSFFGCCVDNTHRLLLGLSLFTLFLLIFSFANCPFSLGAHFIHCPLRTVDSADIFTHMFILNIYFYIFLPCANSFTFSG